MVKKIKLRGDTVAWSLDGLESRVLWLEQDRDRALRLEQDRDRALRLGQTWEVIASENCTFGKLTLGKVPINIVN